MSFISAMSMTWALFLVRQDITLIEFVIIFQTTYNVFYFHLYNFSYKLILLNSFRIFKLLYFDFRIIVKLFKLRIWFLSWLFFVLLKNRSIIALAVATLFVTGGVFIYSWFRILISWFKTKIKHIFCNKGWRVGEFQVW